MTRRERVYLLLILAFFVEPPRKTYLPAYVRLPTSPLEWGLPSHLLPEPAGEREVGGEGGSSHELPAGLIQIHSIANC